MTKGVRNVPGATGTRDTQCTGEIRHIDLTVSVIPQWIQPVAADLKAT